MVNLKDRSCKVSKANQVKLAYVMCSFSKNMGGMIM